MKQYDVEIWDGNNYGSTVVWATSEEEAIAKAKDSLRQEFHVETASLSATEKKK